MSAPITVEQVAIRLNNFPHDTYLYLGGFMRSVAWAAGTLVLLEILTNFNKYRLRLLPWVASMLATVVTVSTWGRGVLLTNSRASLGDMFFPILMGIAEFCLFAVLSPQRILGDQDDTDNGAKLWHYWFFAQAIHALLAAFLVLNRIYHTDPVNDFDKTLQPLATEYMEWMRGDVIGASIGTVMFTGLGVLTVYLMRRSQKSPDRRRLFNAICAGLVLIPIFIYSMVIYQANQQRQRTDEYVFSHLPPPPVVDTSKGKSQP
jgi:hypothetical protein